MTEKQPAICEIALSHALQFGDWLHGPTREVIFSDLSNRQRLALSLLNLSLEHFDAIIILSEHRFLGSTFALARPIYEACLRARWILRTNDAQLQKFQSGSVPRTEQLLKDIEDASDPLHENLFVLFDRFKKLLHDFTHGGAAQAHYRLHGNDIESNYPVRSHCEILYFSTHIAFLAGASLFDLSNDHENGELLVEKSRAALKAIEECLAR